MKDFVAGVLQNLNNTICVTSITYVPAISFKGASIEEIYKFFLHILVDVAVAGESFTAFLMTAE